MIGYARLGRRVCACCLLLADDENLETRRRLWAGSRIEGTLGKRLLILVNMLNRAMGTMD